MNIDKVKHIIQQGEGLQVEFKKSQFELNSDVFDSVCGFLNRYGGHLLLGVSQLYLRKQTTFIENKVFPYMTIADLDKVTLEKVRILAANERADHPWQYMNDEELLHSAGLFKRDLQTGTEGYTLAAALLLGTEQTVLNVLPYFKTDAILRRENLDRYDDRDDIRSNLISSYERLIAFVHKHLPDKFYLEGIQRISLRDRVFREVISNLLIHREFGHAYPAKLIIEKDQVTTENWNRAQGIGNIDPNNFIPYPKNPVIARFFKEIGWVDELGSGVRNVYKYAPIYTPGTKPFFIEGDVFKTVIPLSVSDDGVNVTENVAENVTENRASKILDIMHKSPSSTTQQIADILGVTKRTVIRDIEKLRNINKVAYVGPAKGGYWKINH